jgi:hypothetical protein
MRLASAWSAPGRGDAGAAPTLFERIVVNGKERHHKRLDKLVGKFFIRASHHNSWLHMAFSGVAEPCYVGQVKLSVAVLIMPPGRRGALPVDFNGRLAFRPFYSPKSWYSRHTFQNQSLPVLLANL